MNEKILMTTGFNFDGFSINKYIGVYSGECVLGTGYLSSLESGISDVLGTNSKSYTNKLKEAKEYALEDLQEQIVRAGGNAIIGLSISYTMFSRDIIGVVTNGTAVKIDAISYKQSDVKDIPILKYNKNTAFRPMSLCGHSVQDQYNLAVRLFYDSEEEISSILVDMKLVTVFEKVYELKDVPFTNFSFAKKNFIMSDYTKVSFPCENIALLKNAIFVTKKYIQNDELFDISDMDLEQELVDREYHCGNKPSLPEMENLNSAKEIYEYIKEHMKKYNQNEPELMEYLKKSVEVERLYGNEKKETIKYIKDYYKFD